MTGEPEHALAVATRALARRDFSEHGLRERLQRAGVPPAEAKEALAALLRAGLVNDGRFAVSRAQALAERGKGNAAIRFDLQQQGLVAEEIEAALGTLEPERERAERVITRRGGGVATAKLLARRGFDEDAVQTAVAQDA
jgi:SOS response regulatory protein OraA/RecX